jgi:hypothetical protein
MKRMSVFVLCSFFCFGFIDKGVFAIKTDKLCPNWNSELLKIYATLDEGYKNRDVCFSKICTRMSKLQEIVKDFCNVNDVQYQKNCDRWDRDLSLMTDDKLNNKNFTDIVRVDMENRMLLHCQKTKDR